MDRRPPRARARDERPWREEREAREEQSWNDTAEPDGAAEYDTEPADASYDDTEEPHSQSGLSDEQTGSDETSTWLDEINSELSGARSQPSRRPYRPSPTFGPPVKLGAHLRLQAEAGYRGAAQELRPGLYLVAEVPERALRTEVGFVPLLAPLMVNAAIRALEHPDDTVAEWQRASDGVRALLTPPEREPVTWTDEGEVGALLGGWPRGGRR